MGGASARRAGENRGALGDAHSHDGRSGAVAGLIGAGEARPSRFRGLVIRILQLVTAVSELIRTPVLEDEQPDAKQDFTDGKAEEE